MHYAEVAINVSVNETFDYHIPEVIAPRLHIGSMVRVSFGTSVQAGVVLGIKDHTDIETTKPILDIVGESPVLPFAYIQLAYWLSETYMESIGFCVWMMLPPGIIGKGNYQIQLLDPEAKPRGSLQSEIVDYLRDHEGSQRLTKLRSQFRGRSLNSALSKLQEAGIIDKEPFLMPASIKRKTEQVLALTITQEQIPQIARHLGRSIKKADLLEVIATHEDDPISVKDALRLAEVKTKTVLNHLLDEGLIFLEPDRDNRQTLIFLEATQETVDEILQAWRGSAPYVRILYGVAEADAPPTIKQVISATDTKRSQVKKLIDEGLLQLQKQAIWRDSLADRYFIPTIAPQLTPDQHQVWDEINQAIQAHQWDTPTDARFLLHGVTGSGKTEIYLRAIEQTLAQGRQAIFLVPEIALTSQTIRRVAERFPDQVAIYHGSLRKEEKYDTWQRARTGEIQIIVGTRSALFTPLPDVGLVILDEEHDSSYKQSPPDHGTYFDNNVTVIPYHARDVADYLMTHNKGVLILGSATPDISSYYHAQQGQYHYLQLPQRIMGHRQRIHEQAEQIGIISQYQADTEDTVHIGLPPVSLVDMRAELRKGNTSMFSRDLEDSLRQVIERGEQAMLLLNRRGQATYVFCRDCGYVVMCDRCDSPMTYHRHGEAMRCHHCGNMHPTPEVCPSCESKRIRYFGAGTQQVEQALKKLFPDVRTLRWDADTANNPEMHHTILQQFIDRQADVMIGTQMIAKGLDLPLVTLVGVVSADLGLALPDYRAGERVFQLLTQVAGRAGRGILGGKVILQTYQPQQYVMQFAKEHDYIGFAEKELAYRREMGYPPYRRLARVLFQYKDFYKAQKQAEEGARRVEHLLEEHQLTGTEMIGPAPCFFTRIDGNYRWHLLLRGPNPSVALHDLKLEHGWRLDIDPVDIL